MNVLFRRRIYKNFGLLRDSLMTERHYNSIRTLKAVHKDFYIAPRSRLPFTVVNHKPAACLVYSKVSRRLSHDVHSHKGRFETAADGRWSNRCNCCGLNSKGAQDLAVFLTDELKLEKWSAWNQLPKLHGFHLTSSLGPSVVLTRKYYDEVVRIRFSVTNSLFEDMFAQFENTEGGQEDTDDDASHHLVCRPAFDVEVDHGGDELLVIHCVFTPPSDLAMSLDDTLQDTFYIDGVAVVPRQSQMHSDNTYFMSKASISTRLRRQLLSMLARRGVGPTFARQLIELSTAYEHCCYVNFLEQLRDFLRSVPLVT